MARSTELRSSTDDRAGVDRAHEELSEILRSIEALYRVLDSTSAARRRLVDAEDPGPLLQLLEERGRVVRELQDADTRLQVVHERWEVCGVRGSAAQHESVRVALDEIARLANKVSADDEEDNDRLVRRRGVIATQLSGLSASRAATSAYADLGEPGPRFQDREG